MTASLRGLVALAAVAVLVLVAAIVGGRDEVVDRTVARGLDAAAAVARLVWSRPGQPDVVATRGSNGWLVDGAPADRDAIDAALTALRAARWQRRADAAAAGAIVTELHADATAIGIACSRCRGRTSSGW